MPITNFVLPLWQISDNKEQNTLVFYKISPGIITDTNVSEVLRICSVQNPPLRSFYDVLQKVYIPALFQVITISIVDTQFLKSSQFKIYLNYFLQNEGSAEDIKLQELFENMEVGIKSAITRKKLRPQDDKSQNYSISGTYQNISSLLSQFFFLYLDFNSKIFLREINFTR